MTLQPADVCVCEGGKSLLPSHDKAKHFDEFTSRTGPFQFSLDDLTLNERGSLEDELTLAARMQHTLLPDRAFSPEGWQVHYHYAPAGLFSGDYCDLFETESGMLFFLGDVCGKGLAASILMNQLHATFRSLAARDQSLDAMVEAANHSFCRNTLTGQFATLIAGLARRDGSVEFVSGGHPALLHLRTDAIRCEPATGIPLGLFDGARFPSRRFSLGPGETLLLYTDGLTETQNLVGEEYGLERLRKVAATHSLAAPSELISGCLSDVSEFAAGTKQKDDLTLVAIQRTP